MPLFMDVHTFDSNASPQDLVRALEVGTPIEVGSGVSYLRYWVSEPAGKVFCLVEADTADRPGLLAIRPMAAAKWVLDAP